MLKTFYAVVKLFDSVAYSDVVNPYTKQVVHRQYGGLIKRSDIVVDIEAPNKTTAMLQAKGSLAMFSGLVVDLRVLTYEEMTQDPTLLAQLTQNALDQGTIE